MTKKCDICGKKISWWKFSELIDNKLHCLNCSKKFEINLKEKSKKTTKNLKFSKNNYKIFLIMIGIILIFTTFYIGFISNSGYYNKITEQKYTIQEAKTLCNNQLVNLFNVETSKVCKNVKNVFFLSLSMMILGSILLLIGIIQNLIIYNYNLNKKK